MNYTTENTSIINQVLFGLSSDSIFHSDSMRIASFLETAKDTLSKNNKPSKTIG